MKQSLFFLFILAAFISCKKDAADLNIKEASIEDSPASAKNLFASNIKVGAEELFSEYAEFVNFRKVGLVVNQTSIVNDKHLVYELLERGVNVGKIFALEHGWKGTADAGEKLTDEKDSASGVNVVSLYGSKKKPTAEDLKDIDVVVYDIQDVGVRFYTYISSLHNIMEACAEQNKQLVILDRPNPNGHYIDGPILNEKYKSFVGMHPVPVVHGMTIGEYAQMINGEGWLANGIKCDVKVIKCRNYDHTKFYDVPVKPSPNLPNTKSIYLYPSLCLFEGTNVSVGRGTDKQFQVYGIPGYKIGNYKFVPSPNEGAKSPLHQGDTCYGFDLSKIPYERFMLEPRFDVSFLKSFYNHLPADKKSEFFLANNFFDKLAGTDALRKQIEKGYSIEQIQLSWKSGLDEFQKTRKKYLLYRDFDQKPFN